jgi:hypothetical protein
MNPFEAQNAAIAGRGAVMDRGIAARSPFPEPQYQQRSPFANTMVAPGQAAGALMEEPRNVFGGFDSAGSTNEPEKARMQAALQRSNAEYEARNAPPSAKLAPGSFTVT